MANIKRNCYDSGLSLRTCLVTFTDSRGIRHSVEVTADSLFEAGVLGAEILRKEPWLAEVFGLGTQLEIEVREPATKHVVTIKQIERWLQGATTSPNERVKKDRLRELWRVGETSHRVRK